MAWTYNASPGTSTSAERRDAVRFAIGDTDTNDQQVQDAEISFALTQAGDGANMGCVRSAAIICVRSLMARYARQVDTTHGKLSVGASKRLENYRALLSELQRQQATLAEPFAGGLSIAEKTSDAQDSDAVQPHFEVGMDDYESNGAASRWENA